MTGWAHLTSFVQNDGQTRELLVSAISARLFVKQQHSALGNDPLLHAPYPAFDRFGSPQYIIKHPAQPRTNSRSHSGYLYT